MAVIDEMSLSREVWTPSTFTEWANKYFLSQV